MNVIYKDLYFNSVQENENAKQNALECIRENELLAIENEIENELKELVKGLSVQDQAKLETNLREYKLKKLSISEQELNDYIAQDCSYWFYDEFENLNKELQGQIIAIADLGRWNGRKKGYKIMSNNLNSVLDACGGDYIKVYTDRYDVKSDAVHHDGVNYITYRMLKPTLTEVQIDNFLTKLANGSCTQKDISRYTSSLKNKINQIYGW
jgi:hypothetical protein